MTSFSIVAALALAALPQQSGQQPTLTVEPTQFRLEVDATRKLELRGEECRRDLGDAQDS